MYVNICRKSWKYVPQYVLVFEIFSSNYSCWQWNIQIITYFTVRFKSFQQFPMNLAKNCSIDVGYFKFFDIQWWGTTRIYAAQHPEYFQNHKYFAKFAITSQGFLEFFCPFSGSQNIYSTYVKWPKYFRKMYQIPEYVVTYVYVKSSKICTNM